MAWLKKPHLGMLPVVQARRLKTIYGIMEIYINQKEHKIKLVIQFTGYQLEQRVHY